MPSTLKDVKIGTNGGTQIVDITVQPLTTPEALQGMVMVVFTDIARRPVAKASGTSERATIHHARLAAMAQELQQAHEDLQATPR